MNFPPSHKLPYTTLLHENFSVIITFAFSRPALVKCLNERFKGEWKYLWKSAYDISEQRANRALLELALQLRLIDDKEKLSNYFKQTKSGSLAKIIKKDGREAKLHFRDVTIKYFTLQELSGILSTRIIQPSYAGVILTTLVIIG